jgi:hypothetical protein
VAEGGAATTTKYNTEDKPQEIDITAKISYRRFWILAIHRFPEFFFTTLFQTIEA